MFALFTSQKAPSDEDETRRRDRLTPPPRPCFEARRRLLPPLLADKLSFHEKLGKELRRSRRAPLHAKRRNI